MKSCLRFISLAILIIVTVHSANAQRIAIVKLDSAFSPYYKPKEAVCYDPSMLEQISEEMYNSGNPKYIWVDLLKDQLITEGEGYNIYLNTNQNSGEGNIAMPVYLQDIYLKKWKSFLLSVKENDRHLYIFSSNNTTPGLWRNFNAEDIVDPSSVFRQITNGELMRLELNSEGKRRIFKEYLKDGLASLDKPLSLDLSENGYIINGIRLTKELREKYMALYQQEYGCNFYNDNSSLKNGPSTTTTLGKQINDLKFKDR